MEKVSLFEISIHRFYIKEWKDVILTELNKTNDELINAKI